MADKKVPTQAEAVEQVNQISANNWANQNARPDMVDPIIYREDYKTEDIIWGFDPKKLANADVNISQYWDDSSAVNYDNPNLWGWENTKYSWAETKNSQVAYNKEATLEWLDPNYQYWQAAQMANSAEANYIARRNDEIASALYNAWKTSIEDVANFLNSQQWFQNSTENERKNTVLSVWKRLGDIASQNKNNDGEWVEGNDSPNDALADMEKDLNKGTDWKIYWKVTADESPVIETLEDENSVYRVMNEARIRNFKDMQSMSSDAIAASVVSWLMATDTQTMRDLMQYDPKKYQEVQQQIKALRWQMNINAIASWEWDWTTSATNWQSGISNEKADFISSYSWITNTAELLKSVNSTLNSNVAASTAQEQMATIENDMTNLQNRMKNLKREANQIFKWDVPQYIVNAYIANRRQEIQDQMSVLENRYNMAYSRYQNEWEQTKWNAEFGLKVQELQNKQSQQNIDNYFKQQQIDLTKKELDYKYGETTDKTQSEIDWIIDNLVEQCKNWELGNAQCAAGIQKYYLPSLWIDLWSLSAWSAKQGICNETDLANYQPKKWDLVVMSSPTKPENWHMGIVIWVDSETWTLQYMDWNGSVKDWVGTETAEVRTTTLSNSKIYWYFNPTKDSNKSAWNDNYSYDWDSDNYTDYYRMSAKERWALSNQLRDDIYKWAWWKSAFYAKKKAYTEEVIKPEWTKQGKEVLRSIAELYNMAEGEENGSPTWKLNFNPFSIIRTPWWFWDSWQTASKDKFDQIKEQLKLEKLLEARANGATFGSMTEWEWKIIENAASSLKWDRSDSTINDEMERIISALFHATYWKNITAEDWKSIRAEVEATNDWNNWESLPEENF